MCKSVKDSLFSNAGFTGRQLHGLMVNIITILWVQLHSNNLGSVFSHMFTPVWWQTLKSLDEHDTLTTSSSLHSYQIHLNFDIKMEQKLILVYCKSFLAIKDKEPN